jgi:hypothetical protein
MISERSRTAATLVPLALLALLGCLCSGSGPTPPPSDSCTQPSSGRVDSVELATPRIDPQKNGTSQAVEDVEPRALTDGDLLWLVRGGQGATMVPVRLILRGPEVPSCIAQDTQVMVDGKLAGRNRDSVATYEYQPGARITRSLWLPGAYADSATVSTDVTGLKPSVSVLTVDPDQCSAHLACPCARAYCSDCSAVGLTDGGRQLWQQLLDCRSACLDAGGYACDADGGPCVDAARACVADPY